MGYIDRISYHLNRKDEVPNQDLAKELAEKADIEGIQEIAAYLKDKNKSIASDCLKVLYEIGYRRPDLIVPYTDEFLKMLHSKNNRMVWGGMIAIASIAKVEPETIYASHRLITSKINTGSVITHVWGIYTLINLADNGYYDDFRDQLFELQRVCRPVDFAKRAESILPILKTEDKSEFEEILKRRLPELSNAAQKRINKLLK